MELTCEQVSKTFRRKKAVDHVSFFNSASECMPLLGANGSGKTTLIRMLAGLLPPSEGSICFDQISIAKQYDTYCASFGIYAAAFWLLSELYGRRIFILYGTVETNAENTASTKDR